MFLASLLAPLGISASSFTDCRILPNPRLSAFISGKSFAFPITRDDGDSLVHIFIYPTTKLSQIAPLSLPPLPQFPPRFKGFAFPITRCPDHGDPL
jgi:hypothetical protein